MHLSVGATVVHVFPVVKPVIREGFMFDEYMIPQAA